MMQQSSHGTPEFVAVSAKPQEVDADLCIIPVFENEEGFDDLAGLDAATGHEITRARQSGEFRGRPYEWFLAPISGGKWAAKRVVLIGCGHAAQLTAEIVRRVAAAAGYIARNRGVDSVAWIVRPVAGLTAAAIAQ